MSLSISISDNHEVLSRRAAERILAALGCKPDLLLCAAGGSTPARAYQLLAEHHAPKPSAFAALRLVQLDEWGGLSRDDPGSCETQLRAALITPLGLASDRCFGFRSDAADPHAECERVRARLAAEGPIDLCVLGLGLNGHVGMNEPEASLPPFAHVARLTEVSLRHPMLVQSRTRPTHGLTLGLAEILASHEILLLVSGTNKRAPLQRLLKREVTTEFPASLLWLHPNWTLLCDRAAAAGLDLDQ
jgi:galactosamine-6-phosphate isomerase